MSSFGLIARRPLRLLGLLLVAYFLMYLTYPVSAQTPQGLGGQVVNGTPGGSVADLPLAVYMVSGDKTQLLKEGKTDRQGKFSWPDLTGPVDARFVVSTTYQGVAYSSEQAALPAPAVALRIYDATGDDKAIRIAKAGMVVLQVDAQAQMLRMLETLTLRNSGNRTFLPSIDGPRGPMGLLRFGLPEGAGNLIASGRLEASSIIQVNTGFATDMPVVPGDTEITYTYEIAYGALSEGGYAKLTKSIPYPADIFSLLVTQGDFSVDTSQLVAKENAAVGARRYRQWAGENLPAHTELTLELRNLPLVLPALRPGNPVLQVMVGFLVLAVVVFPVMYARNYARNYAREGRATPESSAPVVPSPNAAVSPRGRQADLLKVRRTGSKARSEKESGA